MDTTIISNPIVKSFLAGSLSGTCSIILFQPFDLIKTRIQVAAISMPIMSPKSGVGVNTTMYNIFRTVVRNESVSGLWKGSSPSFLRCVPGVGTYFSSLHWLKSKFFKERKPTGTESFVLGFSARSFTTMCTLPMTVVKTRFESGKFNYRSISEALVNIYSKEGPTGLYRGITATLLRDAPFSGLYLMFYNTSKSLVQGGALCNFGCGVISGVLASLISQPADVIKTKMQVDQSRVKISNIVLVIYKDHGIKGFFRGIAPRVTRRTLMAAMAWTVYEQISKFLNL